MSTRDESPARASEQTPLLSRSDSLHDYEEANGVANDTESQPHPDKSKRRWPTIIALSLLCVAIILALVFGFATPAAVEEYAKEAASFEADRLSIETFTSTGIRARVQGTVWLDSSKVQKKSVRDLGRFATWFAKEVESGESELLVFLPDYHNALLGRAQLPPVKLNVQDGHYNFVDIVTDLEPGNVDGIRTLAHDFLEGNLKEVRVRATAKVPIKSGIISLGAQSITQYLTFSGGEIPSIPKPELQRLKVAESGLPGHPDGIKAWAQVAVMNDYPVNFDIPPMAFEVLLPDCFGDDYLSVAKTKTDTIHILPKQMLNVSATAFMKQLPTSLTSACPNSDKSPLDTFIAGYLKGQKTTVYARGGEQDPETPEWIEKLLKDTIVPVPLPVKPFDNVIKNFSLSNVHFSLPQTPQGKPILSATVRVLVGLPKDMNFDIDVGRVRADGTVFYQGEEMGKLDLSQWQKARSRKADGDLLVESEVVDAPIDITDEEVFTKVVQRMIFERKSVPLGIEATVDVDATTALGTFVVNGIPAKGKIVFDAPNIGGFKHEVRDISVVGSTATSLTMKAKVNISNPTEYSASLPLVNVSTWVNDTRMGYAWASAEITPGENEIVAYVHWEKSAVGSEFLSQFISGHNVSLTVADPVIHGMPDLKMNFSILVPHMFGKFMRDTTVHLFTSTATFILFSPLAMLITGIDATAYYNGSEIGTIVWDEPIAIEPGENLTPRLPVDWNTPGSDLIRDALGGRLKIDALANVGVKIGDFREEIWYSARGIGAHIRL